MESKKKCTKCNSYKSTSNFYKRKASKDGLNHWCKSCHVSNNLKWTKENPEFVKNKKKTYYDKYPERIHNKELKYKFNIDVNDYNEMLKSQNCKCAICGREEMTKDRNGNIRRMSVDHCHDTKKVRGLLCGKCNTALGLFEDNINSLEKAIEYLRVNNE